jgi:hypothetical protein
MKPLLSEALRTLTQHTWKGGATTGYYCGLCHHYSRKKAPRMDEIDHTADCIIARLRAAIIALEAPMVADERLADTKR